MKSKPLPLFLIAIMAVSLCFMGPEKLEAIIGEDGSLWVQVSPPGFGNQDNVLFLLSNELKSRAELQSIKLDILGASEGITFLKDLLSQFHIVDDGRWAFPLSPEAVTEMLAIISREKELTPRRIMHYANHVLMEKLSSIGPELAVEISIMDVKKALSEEQLGSIDID